MAMGLRLEIVKADRGQGHVCEIYSWCPVEIDELPMQGFNLRENVPLLDAAKDFTVLIKNSVQFPKFGEALRNIQTDNATYLKTCNYNPDTDLLCPIFKLGKIVELAHVDFDDIAYKVNFYILGGFPEGYSPLCIEKLMRSLTV